MVAHGDDVWVARVARVPTVGPGSAGPAPLRSAFPVGPDGIALFVAARDRWRDAVFVERQFAAIVRRWRLGAEVKR